PSRYRGGVTDPRLADLDAAHEAFNLVTYAGPVSPRPPACRPGSAWLPTSWPCFARRAPPPIWLPRSTPSSRRANSSTPSLPSSKPSEPRILHRRREGLQRTGADRASGG